jgi:branched-chain amino acid transport system ATP-binding protein
VSLRQPQTRASDTPAQDAGSEATNLLVGKGLTVRFGGLVALRNVDLVVPHESIVGLVGPNGAGKSTLFGVLSGIIQPAEGRVTLDGHDVTSARPQIRVEMGMARTFQHPKLFGDLTVREHLLLADRVRHQSSRIWSDLLTMGCLRRPDPEEDQRIDALVELLGLRPVIEQSAAGLPLGVARLLELGRALATSPRILLLDEPSSGLDTSETSQFEHTLERVTQERGISVLLVEHDVELVMRLCRSIHVLDFGALIAQGSPDEIRADSAVRSAYLGEEIAGATLDAQEDVTMTTTVNDSIGGVDEPPPSREGPPVLSVENLHLRYGDAVALSGVSFELRAGEALAVLGPNGAGKSSLARALSGLVSPYKGTIVFEGREISSASSYGIRRAGVVHLPEGRGVFRSLSVLDNLRMGTANIRGRRARREAVSLALEVFPSLAPRHNQLAGSLSGGEQQMLSLARTIATSPKLVIADELSLGLAPILVDHVFEGLARARAAGVTIIVIEQYVHRALAFADRCVVLQRGTVAWSGPAASAGHELLSHYLGESVTAL